MSMLGNLQAESLKHYISAQLDFHTHNFNSLRILTGIRHIHALKSAEVEPYST